MPQVSIIIPLHNRFDIADKTIESVFNQTNQDFELIIIDDCSNEVFIESDIGQKWKRKFEDYSADLFCLRNEFNLGSGLSRQRGLDVAKGEYVAFLDSDDFWTKDFLCECLNVHYKHPEINATYVTSYYITGELRNKTDQEFTSICETLIKEYRVWQTGSLLWKRQYVSNWESLSSNQDSLFEFNSGLINDKIKLCRGPILNINKQTGYHTHHRVQKSQNLTNQILIYLHYLLNIQYLKKPKNQKYDLIMVCYISILKRIKYLKSNKLQFDKNYINTISKEYNIKSLNILKYNFVSNRFVLETGLLIFKCFMKINRLVS